MRLVLARPSMMTAGNTVTVVAAAVAMAASPTATTRRLAAMLLLPVVLATLWLVAESLLVQVLVQVLVVELVVLMPALGVMVWPYHPSTPSLTPTPMPSLAPLP